MPVYFHETEQQEIDDILQININSTLSVTRIVLPGLLARYAVTSRLQAAFPA
jgi:17beta-estradiol 17-dehydrogenase / very-long-chain 3-oxoacyl-CoA reductase